ncbi:Receptor-like protein EIX2 [Glycine soja]
MKKCVQIDTQALLKLKHGFTSRREILSSWNGEDCCKSKGILCNNLNGHVTTMDLASTISYYSASLGGKIDSSICELQHLSFLNITYNELEGEIPKCIGSCTYQNLERTHIREDVLKAASVKLPEMDMLLILQTRSDVYIQYKCSALAYVSLMEWARIGDVVPEYFFVTMPSFLFDSAIDMGGSDSNVFHSFKDRFFKVLTIDVVANDLPLMFHKDKESRFSFY